MKIEEISEFKYLGYVLSKDGKDTKAINERSRLGWAAFHHKKPILKNKNISRNVKKRVVETYIYPVITYGLDAVTWTKDNIRKIETLQNNIMRAMLGKQIKDRIPIPQLKTDTGIKSLFQIMKETKIKLFVKVKEEKDDNITKKCLEGLVEGKRSRGRPKRRWTDDIKEWANAEKVQTAYEIFKTTYKISA